MPENLLPFEKVEFDDKGAQVDFVLTSLVGERVFLDSRYRSIPARAYIETAIQYANLAPQIDGYRVEQRDGTIVTTLLAHDFFGFDDNDSERLYGCKDIRLERKYGAALLRIAEQQNCFVSEVIINGLLTHFDMSSYRKLGHSVVAMKNGSRTLIAGSV